MSTEEYIVIRNHIIRRIVFVLASPFILLITVGLLAELAAEVYYNQRTHAPSPTVRGQFANLKLHEESFGFVFEDYRGDDYSVVDGERGVTGQPAKYRHTLWIFGNSATFDPYTHDSETMASRLQSLLPNVRVMNLSMPSATASYELARLKLIPLYPADTVMFIDGTGDGGFVQRSCPDGFDFLSNTALYKLACQTLTPHNDPATMGRYWRLIDDAQVYTTSRGAGFEHLIQACQHSELPDKGYHLTALSEDYIDDCHFNVGGDIRIAREVYDYLTRF